MSEPDGPAAGAKAVAGQHTRVGEVIDRAGAQAELLGDGGGLEHGFAHDPLILVIFPQCWHFVRERSFSLAISS